MLLIAFPKTIILKKNIYELESIYLNNIKTKNLMYIKSSLQKRLRKKIYPGIIGFSLITIFDSKINLKCLQNNVK
jgi:hypothetical protein